MPREWLDAVLDNVAAELQPLGFKLQRRHTWFVRKQNGRKEIFDIDPILETHGYRLRVNTLVRFDVVEEIFNRISGVDPRHQLLTATLGMALEHPGASGEQYLFLHSSSDVDAASSQLVVLFTTRATCSFEKFSTLERLDVELNGDGNRVRPWPECARGLIIARLLGRSDYEVIKSRYLEHLTNTNNGFYLRRFLPLVDELSALDPPGPLNATGKGHLIGETTEARP